MEISENTPSTPVQASAPTAFRRFDLLQRVSHLVMLVSFTTLAVTGLPQRFPEAPLSQFIVLTIFGSVETARLIHHICAIALMIVSILHILDVLYRVMVLRVPLEMIPLLADFKQLFEDVRYNLGLRKHRAYYGRYSYIEKAEYYALVWGTLLMGLTGFMMWNPILTAKILPGQFIPAAKAAHGAEAILAVLAIFVWHFYHVHLRHLNKSMFTGKMTRKEMEHEHPAELAQIDEGKQWQWPASEVIRKRQRRFIPLAVILTVVMAGGIVGFISVEDTAPITTVPQGETAEVFVPLTPTPRPTLAPSPTPEPGQEAGADSWEGTYSAMFRNRCSTCHGFTAVGGLSLATYADALKGGNSGPGIVPGDPDASEVVQVQSVGNHPGQLSLDELNQVINWILAGAPEK
jgi:cytochrome b subunit of formate dehydrogenase/mono/diheme cytochrome c family protein